MSRKKSIFLLGNTTGAKHVLHIPPSAVCLPSDKIKDWKEPSWEILCTNNWSNQKTHQETRSHSYCLHLPSNYVSSSAFILFILLHSRPQCTQLYFEPRFNFLLPEYHFSPDFLLCLPSSFPQVCSHLVCSVTAALLQTVFTLAFCLLNSIQTPLFPVNAVLKCYPAILSISCSSLFTLSTAAGSIMWYK